MQLHSKLPKAQFDPEFTEAKIISISAYILHLAYNKGQEPSLEAAFNFSYYGKT